LQLPLPAEEPLTATSEPQLPYVFVGDEAFPLLPNVMRSDKLLKQLTTF